MILETYYFIFVFLAIILILAGHVTKFPPMLLLGSVMLITSGMLGFSGIEREISWDVNRNDLDQNRVSSLTPFTQLTIGSTSLEPANSAVRFELGLFVFSWIFIVSGMIGLVGSLISSVQLLGDFARGDRD